MYITIYLLIYSFIKHLLNIYFVPGQALGTKRQGGPIPALEELTL